ncbi:MAG: hypothetical protein WB681_07500 [Candidatus Cybelea sp.]
MSTPYVFTQDVQSSKNFPSFEYSGTETDNVYHEDREIAGIMYRAANAAYDDISGLWSQPDGSNPSYAIAQNTDGTINYLYMPPMGSSTWTTWQGTGQPDVYHAVNYGMSPASADNTGALQAALNAAYMSGNGGIIFIPPGTYPFTGTVILPDPPPVPGSDNGIIIAGAGGSTNLQQTQFRDLFSFTGLASGRGVRFRDLRISYTAASLIGQPAAIRVSDCEAITCERVYFYDCPQALNLENEANQCGLRDCIIDYGNGTSPLGGRVMVSISGTEDFIDHCIIKQVPQGHSPPGPAGCTGIVIASPGVAFITNTHISDFTIGIEVQGGGPYPLRSYVSNVVCESWTYGVKIVPTSDAGRISQMFFRDCVFAREDDSTDTTSTGVYIDTDGGANAHVSDIFFDNCMCYQWNGPGIQINAGQNIVITGGRYGSNATSMPTSGGIAITGTPTNVTITGADFSPTVPNPAGGTYGTQPYAFSITAAVEGLYVRGCNLTGYGIPPVPIYAYTTALDVEVTDCAGYNDLGMVLQTTPRTGAFSNTSAWTNAPNGWFGPVAFYVMGTGYVSFGTNSTLLTQGEFTLSPGQTASVGGTIAHFLAIGK